MASVPTATSSTSSRSSIEARLRDRTRHTTTAGPNSGRRLVGYGARGAAWLAPRLYLRPAGSGDRAARDSHGRRNDHGVVVRGVGRVLGRPGGAGGPGHGRADGVAPHPHLHRRHGRSEEHTSELQSLAYLVCRLLLEKKKDTINTF